MTCGHESGTATQKLIEWKGDSDESQMDKCGSDGEVGVRLYEVCILVNSHVAGQTKKRGTSNDSTRIMMLEIHALIVCKNYF